MCGSFISIYVAWKTNLLYQQTCNFESNGAYYNREKRAKIQIHPRTPDPYEETSKRQFDGRVKAWRRELHKWDILDDIAKVPLQRGSAHKGDNSGNGARQTGFDGKQVLAPVTAPNSRPKAVSVSGNSERKDASFDPACAHESLGLDSPAGKRARTCGDSSSNSSGGGGQAQSTCVVGICMGEDVAALEGVDYDCEAPDDGSSDGEDVL